MPIAVNKNTTQTPLSLAGRTGTQSIKWIPAPRIYVMAPQSLTNSSPPNVISNGSTPIGWTDLGVVNGLAQISRNRSLQPIGCGLDNKLRMVVTQSVQASLQFSLSQLDDIAFETITGLSPTAAGAGTAYYLGQSGLNQLAVLIVSQNKFDGKEWQYYNPSAYLNFDFGGNIDSLNVTGLLSWFTPLGRSAPAVIAASIFAASSGQLLSVGYGLSPYGEDGFGL